MPDRAQIFPLLLREWQAGLVTRIDDRDVPENSLANIVGLNLSEKTGRIRRDFGSSKFNGWDMPTSIGHILGITSIRNEVLNQEFVVVMGTKNTGSDDGLPHFWIRKWWQIYENASVQDKWVELTEKETVTITHVTSDVIFISTGLSSVVSHYYDTWVVFNRTRGNVGTIDSYAGSTQTMTMLEEHPDWALTDTLDVYRFPETFNLGLDAGTVMDFINSLQWFFGNPVGDRVSIGYQRNVPNRETPVTVEYIKKSFFWDGLSSFLGKAIDQIYFGRETPEYDNLEDLGLSVEMSNFGTNRLDPKVDIDTGGWTSTPNCFAQIDDGESPNDADACQVTLAANAQTNFVIGMHADGDTPAVLPDAGEIRCRVRARVTGNSPASLMRIGLFEYDSPAASNKTVRIETDTQFRELSPSFQDFELRVNIADHVFSSTNPRLGIVVDIYVPPNIGNVGNTFVISHEKINIISFSGQTKAVRLLFIPQYNGYMLGKPIVKNFPLENFSEGALYLPQVKARYAKLDKRITDLFVFSDDGDITRQYGQFRSAFDFKFSESVPNTATPPFAVIASWSREGISRAGTGTVTATVWLTGVMRVDGTGTKFLSELNVGSKITIGASTITVTQIQSDLVLLATPAIAPVVAPTAFTIVADIDAVFVSKKAVIQAGIGTVTSTGSNIVGTGTDFTLRLKSGDWFIVGGHRRAVNVITDDTHLTIVGTFTPDVTDQIYTYSSNSTSAGSDNPQPIPLGRAVDQLLPVDEFIGYELVSEIPSVGVQWRYQIQAAFRQDNQVFVDQDDHVLRLSNYSQNVHDEHTYPAISSDLSGNPLMIFLNIKGELLGIQAQLGKLYVMKQTAAEVIDANSTQSIQYPIDCIAKKGIISSSMGIWYWGKRGAYVFSITGEISRVLSEAIRDEYLAVSDTYKPGIVSVECKDMGCIISNIQVSGALNSTTASDYMAYFYHTEMQIWWKRNFGYPPKVFHRMFDDSVAFSPFSATAYLFKYPDRTLYKDFDTAVFWQIETQWIGGQHNIQKALRLILLSILSDTADYQFQVRIRFDRSTSDFDTIPGKTVNGFKDVEMVVKTPNGFKEFKLFIEKVPAYSEGGTPARIDISEMRLIGETSLTGKEY